MRTRSFVAVPLLVFLGSCSLPSRETAAPGGSLEGSSGTAKQASVSDFIDKHLPPEAKTLADLASKASSVYSGVSSAIDVVTALGTALGFMESQPTPVEQQIAALSNHVDALFRALGWDMRQSDREMRLGAVHAALDHINMLRKQGVIVNGETDGVLSSQTAVYNAEELGTSNTAFTRLYDPDNFYPPWANPKPKTTDKVYDWRVGVPELMQLITVRLQIIALSDNDWRTDDTFHDELTRHYETLLAHYQKVAGGVSCNLSSSPADLNSPDPSLEQYWLDCGDAASGARVSEDLANELPSCAPATCLNFNDVWITCPNQYPCGNPDECRWDQACIDSQVQSSQAYYQNTVLPEYARVRQRLLSAMPLAEMATMLNNLYTYVWPGSDEQPLTASTWGGNRLDAFYRDQVGALRHKARRDDGSWTDTENLGGVIKGAPTSVSWTPDRLDVFVRGTDDSLYHQWGSSAGLDGWYEPLGGVIEDSPHVVSWGPGRLDLFVNGLDRGLYIDSYDERSPGWTTFGGLGGGAVGTPMPVSWGPNRLDIFTTGLDGSLQHEAWDGAAWSVPESLGGFLTSRPTAVSWAPGRLDVFALGTDHALWHTWYDGGWGGWESLGGYLTSAPTVVSWGPGRLDIFARDVFGAVAHNWFDGGAPGGWEPLGGYILGAPVALAPSPGHLDVFVVGSDKSLYHKEYDGQWRDYEIRADGVSIAP